MSGVNLHNSIILRQNKDIRIDKVNYRNLIPIFKNEKSYFKIKEITFLHINPTENEK